MFNKREEYCVDFIASCGKAKDWRITWTKQGLEWHKKEHGDRRPELEDDDFIKNKIKDVIENHDEINHSIKVSSSGKIKKRNKYYEFYKKYINNDYIINGSKGLVSYIKVVVYRDYKNKRLIIVTALKTPKINNKDICKKVKKI